MKKLEYKQQKAMNKKDDEGDFIYLIYLKIKNVYKFLLNKHNIIQCHNQ